MVKHHNRGAVPVMVVLGLLIGASLAMVGPTRPSEALPPATPPVVSSGASGNDVTGGGHGACERALATLAKGDLPLSRAIARVLMTCTENPRVPQLVNALLHRPGGDGESESGSTSVGVTPSSGGSSGTDSSGSGGAGTSAGGAGGGGSGSGGSGGGGSGSGGSGGGGSGGSGSTSVNKTNNGKAWGQADGKGNNG